MFDKMLNDIIHKFGFEDVRTIEFASIIESADEFDELDRGYVKGWYLVLIA